MLSYFFLKGTIMKYKFILVSPWLLKSPVISIYIGPEVPIQGHRDPFQAGNIDYIGTWSFGV